MSQLASRFLLGTRLFMITRQNTTRYDRPPFKHKKKFFFRSHDIEFVAVDVGQSSFHIDDASHLHLTKYRYEKCRQQATELKCCVSANPDNVIALHIFHSQIYVAIEIEVLNESRVDSVIVGCSVIS